MTLAKGIYHRARNEIKNSALYPQLIPKRPGICVVPQLPEWWDYFGTPGSPLVHFL